MADTITRATAADAPAVRDLTRAAYAKWVSVLGREPMPMAADDERAVREHTVDLLLVDGVLAGVIEATPEDDTLLIENLAVSPDFQGRGYGKLLMAHAETAARALGRSRIRLYTNKLFAENVELYRKLGYTLDREQAFKGGVIVHMSKSIL